MSIESVWIRNTFLQKFLQTDMIFFDQFKELKVKYGKCFSKFMIPIALLKGLGGLEFVTIIEVINMRS